MPMKVGETNQNGQLLVCKTPIPSPNFRGQKVWIMECVKRKCGHWYGANGCDAHERKCPNCDGGRPGFRLFATLD